MERKAIALLPDYLDKIELIPREYRLFLYEAIAYYGIDGKDPSFDDIDDLKMQGFIEGLWIGIRKSLDNSIERRESGRKGGQNGTGEVKNRYHKEQSQAIASYDKQSQPINNKELNINNKTQEESIEKNPSPSRFNFKSELLSLGVTEQTASDFMKVRKQKKATDTQTAFNKIKAEVSKANADGVTAEECITMAVENSWQGFSYEWYCNRVKSGPNNENTIEEPVKKVITNDETQLAMRYNIDVGTAWNVTHGKITLEDATRPKKRTVIQGKEIFNLYK